MTVPDLKSHEKSIKIGLRTYKHFLIPQKWYFVFKTSDKQGPRELSINRKILTWTDRTSTNINRIFRYKCPLQLRGCANGSVCVKTHRQWWYEVLWLCDCWACPALEICSQTRRAYKWSEFVIDHIYPSASGWSFLACFERSSKVLFEPALICW